MYLICLVIGLVIPLISVVCNLFDGFIDMSFDFLDIDIGDFTISFLPLSINSICMALLWFGGLGMILTDCTSLSPIVINIIGGAVGYVNAVSLQTLIKTLKRVNNPAESEDMMLARRGRVVTSIEPNHYGSVILSIEGSSDVQYTAKNIDTCVLTIHDEVYVDSFDKGVAQIKKVVPLVDNYM